MAEREMRDRGGEAMRKWRRRDLVTLRERVRAATGFDRELDADLFRLVLNYRVSNEALLTAEQMQTLCPHFTASVDAALALVEKVLPGWQCMSSTNNVAVICRDWNDDYAPVFWSEQFPKQRTPFEARLGTLKSQPLAILSALLAALSAAPSTTSRTEE